jgi:hypothetical protein
LSARTRASLAQTASAIESKLRLRGQEGFPGGGKKVTTLKEERKSDKETLKKGEAACSSSAFQASSGDSEQSTDENHTNISARPRAVIESSRRIYGLCESLDYKYPRATPYGSRQFHPQRLLPSRALGAEQSNAAQRRWLGHGRRNLSQG